jgi:acetyl esterase/lipase
MRMRRILWILLASLATAVLVVGLVVAFVCLYLHPRHERVDGVVYGQRQGHNLSLDVLRPAKTNGFGVVLMVSGGWKSSTPGSFRSWTAAPLLRRGYTVFAVYHISQPNATLMEIIKDVNRAVRYIRHHAAGGHPAIRRLV